MENYIEGTKVFKVLGDPKRAIIVDMLSCGELCACMILEKFKMSQSTLSHHMKLLCESGLVKARDEGKWTYYSLNSQGIEKTKQFFCSITTDKANCICRENKDCCKGCDSSETEKYELPQNPEKYFTAKEPTGENSRKG